MDLNVRCKTFKGEKNAKIFRSRTSAIIIIRPDTKILIHKTKKLII